VYDRWLLFPNGDVVLMEYVLAYEDGVWICEGVDDTREALRRGKTLERICCPFRRLGSLDVASCQISVDYARAYEKILEQLRTWLDHVQPALLSEDSPQLAS
jgi:hypothetical protein